LYEPPIDITKNVMCLAFFVNPLNIPKEPAVILIDETGSVPPGKFAGPAGNIDLAGYRAAALYRVPVSYSALERYTREYFDT
jgi:hypothetical protein